LELIGAYLDEVDPRIFGVTRVGGDGPLVVFTCEEGAGEWREDGGSVVIFFEEWL
jgi:hypothetical protein